jgi:hypothetical protein
MIPNKNFSFFVLTIALVFFMFGCAGRGQIRPQPVGKEAVTIQNLQENWKEYDISYAGSPARPIGIIFDPRDDNKRLVGDIWTQVEDQGTLSRLMGSIPGKASLYTITGGKDNSLYGYFAYTNFTSDTRRGTAGYSHSVAAKAIDENTMQVNLVRQETIDRQNR